MPGFTCTLNREDARRLAEAVRAVTRANEQFELVATRAKLPLMEAVAARNAAVDEIATLYGFNPDRPFTFDAPSGRVVQEEPAPGAAPPPVQELREA